MSTTLPPETTLSAPPDAAGRRRTRAWLVAAALVVLGSTGWWIAYSGDAVKRHEARVIAGDFPSLRLETGKTLEVDEFGRVAVGGFLMDPPLSVGSQRLIPVGTYQAALIANDGVPAHVKKTELVIAVQDASGVWHPSTAPEVIARMRGPRTQVPR